MTKQKSRSKAGSDDEVATQEQELAEYLQERIKPGLNRGSIPLLARSIAKEIVERQHLDDASDDDEADDAGEADEQPTAEADDDTEAKDDREAGEDEYDDEEDADDEEPEAEGDDDYEDEDEDVDEEDEEEDVDDEEEADDEEPSDGGGATDDFEEEMHELQAELGDDWILRFSVEGDNAWLTAEKKDGSQHVEAPTAEVLIEAVELLEQGGDEEG